MRLQGAQGVSVLEVDAQGTYRPKTRESQAAYEALLTFIQVRPSCEPLPTFPCCSPACLPASKLA